MLYSQLLATVHLAQASRSRDVLIVMPGDLWVTILNYICVCIICIHGYENSWVTGLAICRWLV